MVRKRGKSSKKKWKREENGENSWGKNIIKKKYINFRNLRMEEGIKEGIIKVGVKKKN